MTRQELTEKILDIKREKGWSWKYITEEIGGMSPILVVGALLGQDRIIGPHAAQPGHDEPVCSGIAFVFEPDPSAVKVRRVDQIDEHLAGPMGNVTRHFMVVEGGHRATMARRCTETAYSAPSATNGLRSHVDHRCSSSSPTEAAAVSKSARR